LKAIVSPRPIGWISSRSAEGKINLAPYSFFNMISTKPCLIMFSSEGRKDSVTFIEETREFAANLVSANLSVAMNKTSVNAPRCLLYTSDG
ncbi:flavin reductase family protein, partial [Mycobacterium tuberculosis]|nr:flavin reductase family protein [Mycobacterium tuberculosis]